MLSAGIKQRINSTYAQYNDGSVELEARFGRLTQRGFKPGVSRQVFNRIRDYFDQRAQVIETRTTDYLSQNIRKTVTIPSDETPPQTIWITKDRLWNQEDPNYGIRYSMSREIPIQPVNKFIPKIIREKSRYSYNVFKSMVRIDLTVVNMVQGVHKGFDRALVINGVGYRAEVDGKTLTLHLGFSHPVQHAIPDSVEVVVDKFIRVVVRGIDLQAVGQMAAVIRASKSPDPYKGKGVTYEGERIRKKAGKKAVT